MMHQSLKYPLQNSVVACSITALVILFSCSNALSNVDFQVSGFVSAEAAIFGEAPGYEEQVNRSLSPSVYIEPEINILWSDGNSQFNIVPFLRWSADDDRRSHGDIREANWVHIGREYDIVLGIDQVFWGVAESVHLVDVINQTDLVENIDNESKLGQPLLNANWFSPFGNVGVFILPYFRLRTFPDDTARLRGGLPIGKEAIIESSKGNDHIDYALRWYHSFGQLDIGLALFSGTSREPRFILSSDFQSLVPYYDSVRQESIDLQWTYNSTLWKLEGIHRRGHGDRFSAFVVGFEHTLYGLFPGPGEMGFLVELMYDGRDKNLAPMVFTDRDVFLGLRYSHNDEQDSTLLAGAYVDVDDSSQLFFIEAKRRLSSYWSIQLTAKLFSHIKEDSTFAGIEKDSHLTLQTTRHF